MKLLNVKQKSLMFILVSTLIGFATHSSYGQWEDNPAITASTEQPLTEATLDGSVVTLTLSDGTYERWLGWNDVSVSGIFGVTIDFLGTNRVSDTEIVAKLAFNDDFNFDMTLTFTVSAGAIKDYHGPALTTSIRVRAVEESLIASVSIPWWSQRLTEETLDGSIVKLTLKGRHYERWFRWDPVTVSGIKGVTIGTKNLINFAVKRVSDTELTVALEFNGNFDTNKTLTFTVNADAIVGYNGPALTADIRVSAVKESLTASTEFPLTEANLHRSGVILTLEGRIYERLIRGSPVTVSGIRGVTIKPSDVKRVRDSKLCVLLTFSGDFDTDKTLTFTVDPDIIVRYNGPPLTAKIHVSASVGQDPPTQRQITAEQDPPTREQITAKSHILQGPWLWMMTDGADITRDYLNLESGGTITEAQVAQNGVNEGDTVGRFRWTSGHITTPVKACKKFCRGTLFERCTALCWSNNVNKTLNTLGFGKWRNITEHTAYAIINLVSPRDQRDVILSVGSGDAIKVWLNGEVVHRAAETELGCRKVPVPRILVCTPDPSSPKMNLVPVTLKAGDNLLLVKVSQHGEYWDMEVRLTADFTPSIPTAKTLKAPTLTLSDAVVPNKVDDGSPPQLADALITKPAQLREDVNGDGTVNIHDLVLVASNIGQTSENTLDVNGDGIVNIQDLILVAGALGNTAAVPSLHPQALEIFTAVDVKLWLFQAEHLILTDATSLRGVRLLEQLLEVLTPKETTLLPNYPNPFNPETWIPYQLATDADVTITIYAVDGKVIRRLTLRHQPAGIYHNRSRAAYWDGQNHFGEPVASGLYFYTLTADDFTATRKMLIRK